MTAPSRMSFRAALTPVVIGVSAALILAGCNFNGFNASANCDSNGKNCSADFHQSSRPAHHTRTPAPVTTVTQTETPSQAPTEPVVTASPVEVGPCSVLLTQEDMDQLATSEPARQNLMDCMQIPGDQRPEMDNWLAQNALDSVNSTPDERRHWEQHQLAGAYRQYS
jgi:hypothetical protein